MLKSLLLVQLIATGFMTGLIWTMQVVHYPLYDRIDAASFRPYVRSHMNRISLIVGPLMLIEGAAAIGIIAIAQSNAMRQLAWVGAALLVIIWLSTALIQGPAHARLLQEGFNNSTIRRLVSTNWIRTIGWSARLVIAAVMLRHVM